MTVFEFIVPVVVVGGGASGAVAALAAGTAGAEVLIVEQDAAPTGTTAMSQGLVCAAGTRQQKALGIEDDADTLYTDILAKTRGQTDPAEPLVRQRPFAARAHAGARCCEGRRRRGNATLCGRSRSGRSRAAAA